MILQATTNGIPKEVAVEPFRKFIASPDQILDEHFYVDLLQKSFPRSQSEDLVTPDSFRMLYSAIQRNTSAISPINGPMLP